MFSAFDPAWLWAPAALLGWGFSFLPVKRVQAPGSLGIIYSMLAGIACYLLMFLAGGGGPARPEIISPGVSWLALNGLTQFLLASIFYYEGLRSGEVSLVAPLTRTKIVFVVLIILAFRLEEVSPALFAAVAAGLAGGWLLIRPPAGRRPVERAGRAVACATGAAFFWAIGEIFTFRALDYYSPLETSLFSVLLGFGAYLAWLVGRGRAGLLLAGVSRRDRRLYFTHGILNYGVGYFCFFNAISQLGVGRASVIVSAWPLVSALYGMVFFRESASPVKCAGILLLVGSAMLALF